MATAPFKNLLQFCDAATQAAWIDKHFGIVDQIAFAVQQPQSAFRIIKTERTPDVWTLDFEWNGRENTLRCLDRDFYTLWGNVACEEQYIGRVLGQHEVTFSVLVGQSGPRAYGFALCIRIHGAQVQDLLARMRERTRSRDNRASDTGSE